MATTLLTCVAAAAPDLSSPSAHTAPAAKPQINFVFILADDVGNNDLSIYGHPTIVTPELDRMAAEGALFTQAYSAAPICTPSRASFHTGRLPVRNGLYNNLTKARDAWMRKDGIGGLPKSETTLASRLRNELGYDTLLLGKWHLGANQTEFLPLAHGFDHWFGTPSTHDHNADLFNVTAAGPPLYRPCTAVMRDSEVVGRLTDGGMPPMQQTQCNKSAAGALAMAVDELIPLYTANATRFIQSHARLGAKPFYLSYCPDNTHKPTYASAKWRGQSRRGAYGDAVQELDESVGAILAALRAAPSLDSSTLVAFTSDNGGQGGQGFPLGSNGMLRCMKGSTWEGGVREPLLVRWPGTVPQGARRLQPVSLMDLFATAIAAAGLPPSADGRPIDGKDLRGVLADSSAPSPHAAGLFYWRGDTVMAVRVGAYKVHFYTQGCTLYTQPPLKSFESSPLVYHLEEDPGEEYPLDPSTNAAAAKAVKAAAKARDDHVHEIGALAPPQLNRCDAAAFLWDEHRTTQKRPPSRPYDCYYADYFIEN